MIVKSYLSILTLTSAFLAPCFSYVGVSHVNSVGLTNTPGTSSYAFPEKNLTTIFYESLNPSPFIVTLVLPVNGPKHGLIEYIAYGGPTIDDTFNANISFIHAFDQPPNINILESYGSYINVVDSLAFGFNGFSSSNYTGDHFLASTSNTNVSSTNLLDVRFPPSSKLPT